MRSNGNARPLQGSAVCLGLLAAGLIILAAAFGAGALLGIALKAAS